MYDLIIIGAGPAGLTAGLYGGRYRLNTLILEKMSVGGQIILSQTIENFPGFPGGIATEELIARFKKQVDDVGVAVKEAEVTAIEKDLQSQAGYLIKTKDGSFQSRGVIIASGASWKRLGVPGEEKLIGKGVSYCGTCDAPFFRNKEVVVVGAGDHAFEDAIFLTTYASKVTIVHRRQGFRCAKILEEKAKANPKINFILDTVIEEILGENKVEGVRLKNLVTGQPSQLSCQGVFVFIGVAPNSAFVKEKVKLDEGGFIITDENMQTSFAGVFACGDCRKKTLYQVVNGCGEGAVAAHSAHTYLLNK
ncbi:MAG: thioredoxin-disulfide reductase [Candidatus Omnitrophica bacterium]|jgi:thioredoxin reductase (NADPH)|nr:thioredoxin-disulfide reductase [Candidatus Omnitrophota bacterium]MDD5080101.1 thioredoxin-disulfide reductase [Candidatus Omnitrophota bacterium]